MLQVDEKKFENISTTLQLLTTTEEKIPVEEAKNILALFKDANKTVKKVYCKQEVYSCHKCTFFC